MAAIGRGDRRCEGLEKENAKSPRKLVYMEEGRKEGLGRKYGEERGGVETRSGRPKRHALYLLYGDN